MDLLESPTEGMLRTGYEAHHQGVPQDVYPDMIPGRSELHANTLAEAQPFMTHAPAEERSTSLFAIPQALHVGALDDHRHSDDVFSTGFKMDHALPKHQPAPKRRKVQRANTADGLEDTLAVPESPADASSARQRIYPKCAKPGCEKQAQRDCTGATRLCKAHMRDEGLNPAIAMCQQPGCGKQARKDASGSQKYCISHMQQQGFKLACACQHDGCNKKAQRDSSGGTSYCIVHMRERGLDVKARRCQHAGCTKQAQKDNSGHTDWCINHMRNLGLAPNKPHCQHPNCNKLAKTKDSNGQRIFCIVHMREHGLQPGWQCCSFEGCSNQAQRDSSGKTEYCVTHMRAEGRFPSKRRCQQPGCPKQAKRDDTGALRFCIAHMHERGMRLGEQRCQEEGCNKQARRDTTGGLLFCIEHMRQRGLVPVERRCHVQDCQKLAMKDSSGHVQYCILHMRERGLAPTKIKRRCKHEGCQKFVQCDSTGGYTYCKAHMRDHGLTPGMQWRDKVKMNKVATGTSPTGAPERQTRARSARRSGGKRSAAQAELGGDLSEGPSMHSAGLEAALAHSEVGQLAMMEAWQAMPNQLPMADVGVYPGMMPNHLPLSTADVMPVVSAPLPYTVDANDSAAAARLHADADALQALAAFMRADPESSDAMALHPAAAPESTDGWLPSSSATPAAPDMLHIAALHLHMNAAELQAVAASHTDLDGLQSGTLRPQAYAEALEIAALNLHTAADALPAATAPPAPSQLLHAESSGMPGLPRAPVAATATPLAEPVFGGAPHKVYGAAEPAPSAYDANAAGPRGYPLDPLAAVAHVHSLQVHSLIASMRGADAEAMEAAGACLVQDGEGASAQGYSNPAAVAQLPHSADAQLPSASAQGQGQSYSEVLQETAPAHQGYADVSGGSAPQPHSAYPDVLQAPAEPPQSYPGSFHMAAVQPSYSESLQPLAPGYPEQGTAPQQHGYSDVLHGMGPASKGYSEAGNELVQDCITAPAPPSFSFAEALQDAAMPNGSTDAPHSATNGMLHAVTSVDTTAADAVADCNADFGHDNLPAKRMRTGEQ